MKKVIMKGKNIDDAVAAACEVLGVAKEAVSVRVISEGKPAVMGIIGGAEAEVEVGLKEGAAEEARIALQAILDKMELMAACSIQEESETDVTLDVKGEDIARIIGKEGAMLKSLETVVTAMIGKVMGARVRVHVDAGGYRQKRVNVLEKLAGEVVADVKTSGQERVMPPMEPADRRAIHLFLKDHPDVTSFSRGEGRDRRLVIAPKQ
jgi:spoIIIJ-associated protein